MKHFKAIKGISKGILCYQSPDSLWQYAKKDRPTFVLKLTQYAKIYRVVHAMLLEIIYCCFLNTQVLKSLKPALGMQ